MFVRTVEPERVNWDKETDFLIVGGGGCGLSAAAAASTYGCDVTLVEKADRTGGKARVATGQICGVGSSLQRERGIEDSAEEFYHDLVAQQTNESSERYDLNRELIETVAGNSGPTMDWLNEEVDANLTLHTGRFAMPGHRVYRTHYPVRDDGIIPRTGEPVTDKLSEYAKNHGVDIRTNYPADQLLLHEATNEIIGIVSKRNPEPVPRRQHNEMINADHILLACDGFAANAELVTELIPDVADLDYWGTRENTGEAVRMARELELQLDEPLYDMHGPFTIPNSIYLPNELVKAGAIIVNKDAERFMDCGNVPYRVMDMHILNQEDATAYLIIDQNITDDFLTSDLTRHQFSYVMDANAFEVTENINDLAAEYELDATSLRETILSVNSAIEGESVPFGRQYSYELTPPFYSAKIRPMYVKARQGIKVNQRMQVLRADRSFIENLYAGGNASESLEGGDSNVYIPGMDLMTALTEGRLVGEHVGKLYGGD